MFSEIIYKQTNYKFYLIHFYSCCPFISKINSENICQHKWKKGKRHMRCDLKMYLVLKFNIYSFISSFFVYHVFCHLIELVSIATTFGTTVCTTYCPQRPRNIQTNKRQMFFTRFLIILIVFFHFSSSFFFYIPM